MTKTYTLAMGMVICLAAGGCKFIAGAIVAYKDSWDNGQPRSEGRTVNGISEGEWVLTYRSGRLHAKGRYQNDHRVGTWLSNYENGTLEWTGTFDDKGRRSGEWSLFYPDATLQARGAYLDDFDDGTWQFFATDGSLEKEGQFDQGKPSGPWSYYYPGNKPKAAGLFHRGQRIGTWRFWDEAGQQRVQEYGTTPGTQIVQEKWPNGENRRLGILQDGAQVGRWTIYHDNGKPRFACTLRAGRPSGIFEAREGNGNLVAQGVLQDGQFAEGCTAMQNGESRAIPAGPLPAAAPAPGEWASSQALASMLPETIVAVFARETTAPIEPAATLAKVEPPAEPPPPAVAEVVQKIDEEPVRVPAKPQADFTALQREEIKNYVQNYTEGFSKERTSRRNYTPSGGARSASSPHRRAELEGKPLPFKSLRGVDGKDLDLEQYRGKQVLLLVILRGFSGEVCVYCVAQTAALADSEKRLAALGVEVLVLFPGVRENVKAFKQAYACAFGEKAPPYHVFYDPDLEIVNQLGITGELATPTTLIVGKDGLVKYAYVGKTIDDRPAMKELIKFIEGLEK